MRVLFLDLARRTGFAFGDSRMKPISWSVELSQPGEDAALQCAELARQLSKFRDEFGEPDLCGIEHWMPPRKGIVDKNVEPSLRLNGAVHAIVGGIWRCRVVEPHASTIRVAVCGKAHAGGRDETKKMVVSCVKMLGLLPKHSTDDDRADALAGWHFIASTFAREFPAEFMLR
jgi:Holliday junction resolvasome RuvABC endonuclease subunit